MPIKSLKEIALETFLKNKVGQKLSDEEINLLYNNFGFKDGVFYLTDTSGYMIDKDKLSTWKVNYTFHENGEIKEELWYKDGKRHKINGPAYSLWYETGQLWVEVWYKNEIRHREDGPAYQLWYENGQLKEEKWCKNGEFYREDGPAYQSWYSNGQNEREEWYKNGKLINGLK